MISATSYLSNLSPVCKILFFLIKYSPSATLLVCLQPISRRPTISKIYVCLNFGTSVISLTKITKASLESLSKNKIKWIRSLQQKKNRISEGLFTVEGEKMVKELIQNMPELIRCVVTTSQEITFTGDVYNVSNKEMTQISGLQSPNKLLAVVEIPEFKNNKSNFILALDGIQDPGNMGTIMRTADWFGIDQIICSKSTVDIFNPKVVQSSMGSIFQVPVNYVDLEEYLGSTNLPIYGALLEGDNIYTQSFERKGIILMGNEGKGISKSLYHMITSPIHIPKVGYSESLNVAIATGIILSEFSRK